MTIVVSIRYWGITVSEDVGEKSNDDKSSLKATTEVAQLVDEVTQIIELRCNDDNAIAYDWLVSIYNPLESRKKTATKFQKLREATGKYDEAQGKYDKAQEKYDEKSLNRTLNPDDEQDLLSAEQDLLSAEQGLLSAKRGWMNRFLVDTKSKNTKKNIPTLQKFIKKYGNWKPFQTVGDKDNWLSAYNDTFIPFVGREEEINLLNAFVEADSDTNFKLWAMTGPSGAGKTRLLVHWGNSGILADWDVKHLSSGTALDLDKIKRSTLISIDDIYGYDEVIADIITAAREKKFVHPVRLLLLDHATPKTVEELLKNPRYGFDGHKSEDFGLIRENFFYKDAPLKLEVPDGEDGNKFLSDIICEISKRDADDPVISEAIVYLNNTKAARQPLFAALVGDAILRGGKFAGQNRQDLINGYLNDRHRVTWLMDKSDSIYPKGTWAACFIAAATTRHGADYRTLFEAIPDNFQTDKDYLQRDIESFKALCSGVVSDGDPTRLKQFEPDILGESHFLLFLKQIQTGLWKFEGVLAALIEAGDTYTANEAARSFINFFSRVSRNLLNDDQESESTKGHWEALAKFLSPDHFTQTGPFRWAIACTCFDIALMLKEAGHLHRANAFLQKIEPNDIFSPPKQYLKAGPVWLAIHYFALYEDYLYNIPEPLLALLSKFDSQFEGGDTALTLSLLTTSAQIPEYLVAQNINDIDYLSAQRSDGWSALMIACQNGQEAIALQLIEAGVNMSVCNKNKQTALMLAVFSDLRQVISELIVRNVEMDSTIIVGGVQATALGIARVLERREIIDMLEAAGAKELPPYTPNE